MLVAIAPLAYPKRKTASTASELAVWQVKSGSVHDGDTIRVIKGNQELKIRSACIDAPEVKQDKGIAARDHLRSLIDRANNQVKVNAVDTDRYRRTVAELFVLLGDKWEQVQLAEVKAGMVWANGRYKSDCPNWSAIEAAENEARSQRKGIWAGNPTPPWDFRSSIMSITKAKQ